MNYEPKTELAKLLKNIIQELHHINIGCGIGQDVDIESALLQADRTVTMLAGFAAYRPVVFKEVQALVERDFASKPEETP